MATRLLSFWFILFALGVPAMATYFEILDNEGNSIFGTIVQLDRTQIIVDAQGEQQTIPLEKLVIVRNLASNPYTEIPAANFQHQQRPMATLTARSANERRLAEFLAGIQGTNAQAERKIFPDSVVALELKDDSRLTASSFTIAGSLGAYRLLEQQEEQSIPLEHLSAVRFAVGSLHEVINPPADWQRVAVPHAGGDRLVIGNPGSFELYAGILGNVSAEAVSFNVDGDILPIPRRRVYGIVFHGDITSATYPASLATLSLWSGTQAMISDIELTAGQYGNSGLTLQTTSGLTITVPLDMVSEMNFGESGVAHLFDFERVRNEFSLPIALNMEAEPLRLMQTFLESRTRVSREIVLDGIAYERGVTLKGQASLEYHLPSPFASLSAVIGIEDQFRPHASATLQILADSQVLGVWELRGDAAARRIHVNLPQNSQRITIITEPSLQSGIPTVVTIAEPKLFE